jgi:hypothetical protein
MYYFGQFNFGSIYGNGVEIIEASASSYTCAQQVFARGNHVFWRDCAIIYVLGHFQTLLP